MLRAADDREPEAPKAAADVANKLRRRIVTGQVPVGGALPAESKLLAELGVSRPSLRAALRILESEELVTMRRGSRGGAWVNAPTDQALAGRAGVYLQYHRTPLDEVHRARLVVEPPAVALLARRADGNDADVLQSLVDHEGDLVADGDAFRGPAVAFHRKVVELAGNQTLIVFASMIYGIIESQAGRRPPVPPGRYRQGGKGHDEHLRVIELIRAGAAREAEALWHEHLERARQTALAEGGEGLTVDHLPADAHAANQRGRIRIPKAAELVADTLRRRIITGEYRPGDLLAPEGSLMETFDVARTTIRDAFRVLESEGLLEVRRGSGGGGRVREPGVGMVASYAALFLQFQGATLDDVHLGRTLIEAPVAAMLAARRDEPAIVDALRGVLDEEAAVADDARALTLAEGRFHQMVVELAGNRVLRMLSAVANRLIAQQVQRSVADSARRVGSESFARAHRAHQRLVELIAVGADREAEELWRRHLESGMEQLSIGAKAARTVIDLLP